LGGDVRASANGRYAGELELRDDDEIVALETRRGDPFEGDPFDLQPGELYQIGRASCRERV